MKKIEKNGNEKKKRGRKKEIATSDWFNFQ